MCQACAEGAGGDASCRRKQPLHDRIQGVVHWQEHSVHRARAQQNGRVSTGEGSEPLRAVNPPKAGERPAVGPPRAVRRLSHHAMLHDVQGVDGGPAEDAGEGPGPGPPKPLHSSNSRGGAARRRRASARARVLRPELGALQRLVGSEEDAKGEGEAHKARDIPSVKAAHALALPEAGACLEEPQAIDLLVGLDHPQGMQRGSDTEPRKGAAPKHLVDGQVSPASGVLLCVSAPEGGLCGGKGPKADRIEGQVLQQVRPDSVVRPPEEPRQASPERIALRSAALATLHPHLD
mmetsp:Transcript_21472/g.64436  ORF Transcript_21472/g.64436 Transcript_21472/m.64436 type:complete len:292 (-) Transcript_21472:189-1064(-)